MVIPGYSKVTAATTTTYTKAMTDFERAEKYVVVRRNDSFKTIWQQWYGLGLFRNQPIEGGIDACEKRWKNKWRATRPYGESDYILLLKSIMRGYTSLVKTKKVSPEDAVKKLDEDFRSGRVKRSVYKMIDELRRQKLIAPAKPRGVSVAYRISSS